MSPVAGKPWLFLPNHLEKFGKEERGRKGGREKGLAKAYLNYSWLFSFTSCTKNKSFTLPSLLSAMLQSGVLAF